MTTETLKDFRGKAIHCEWWLREPMSPGSRNYATVQCQSPATVEMQDSRGSAPGHYCTVHAQEVAELESPTHTS